MTLCVTIATNLTDGLLINYTRIGSAFNKLSEMGSPGAHFGSKLGSTKGLSVIYRSHGFLKCIENNLKIKND